MPLLNQRNPESAEGDWYIDTRCIDCLASLTVAPGLIVERGGMCVFARQPATHEEERDAWRAAVLCPTASIGTVTRRSPPDDLFPERIAPGVFRCGFNAMSSFGAHSYLVTRDDGNLLVDSPRFAGKLLKAISERGGIADLVLTHRDDVADAERYARELGSRVWIHEDDRDAAPFATNLIRGRDAVAIRPGVLAIPVPGHTRGSVVYLVEDTSESASGYLFTGDSLAWDFESNDLTAFRDACWYSWEEQTRSLQRLLAYPFEWVFAGHGGSIQLPADEMRRRLQELVERMQLA